ncbi:hypothetical protein EJB05_40589, partial [Eragrostis curvula]
MAITQGNGAVRENCPNRQHAEGPAAVLAIGTANPLGAIVLQEEFIDHFFRVFNSNHHTDLKGKLKRIYCMPISSMKNIPNEPKDKLCIGQRKNPCEKDEDGIPFMMMAQICGGTLNSSADERNLRRPCREEGEAALADKRRMRRPTCGESSSLDEEMRSSVAKGI